jgi:hypothetical protein
MQIRIKDSRQPILWTDANLRVSTTLHVQILVISWILTLYQCPAVFSILTQSELQITAPSYPLLASSTTLLRP